METRVHLDGEMYFHALIYSRFSINLQNTSARELWYTFLFLNIHTNDGMTLKFGFK